MFTNLIVAYNFACNVAKHSTSTLSGKKNCQLAKSRALVFWSQAIQSLQLVIWSVQSDFATLSLVSPRSVHSLTLFTTQFSPVRIASMKITTACNNATCFRAFSLGLSLTCVNLDRSKKIVFPTVVKPARLSDNLY